MYAFILASIANPTQFDIIETNLSWRECGALYDSMIHDPMEGYEFKCRSVLDIYIESVEPKRTSA